MRAKIAKLSDPTTFAALAGVQSVGVGGPYELAFEFEAIVRAAGIHVVPQEAVTDLTPHLTVVLSARGAGDPSHTTQLRLTQPVRP